MCKRLWFHEASALQPTGPGSSCCGVMVPKLWLSDGQGREGEMNKKLQKRKKKNHQRSFALKIYFFCPLKNSGSSIGDRFVATFFWPRQMFALSFLPDCAIEKSIPVWIPSLPLGGNAQPALLSGEEGKHRLCSLPRFSAWSKFRNFCAAGLGKYDYSGTWTALHISNLASIVIPG